eukprot:CAMPEP_0180665018 /NCGR_PEP_ID=MMETSP1037_2-20121125/61021_1 /TAXON_ID=632150 /ORGANISM="Azadinium spinosum, Strain 3D9" /LENGTH=59 /DNA_ID=CAMNT_0022693359 /DNA_START=39 /DNA_END=215 /DNA_ORIENTATION=-
MWMSLACRHAYFDAGFRLAGPDSVDDCQPLPCGEQRHMSSSTNLRLVKDGVNARVDRRQ